MTLKHPPLWTFAAILISMVLNTLPILIFSAQIFSLGTLCLGVFLILRTAWVFKEQDTPILPHNTPKHLITSGPFQWNRNPIYTGMILITLGVGAAQGSLLGVIPACVLFWVLDRYFAAPEEQLVIDTFGTDGKTFVDNVRRW